MEKQKGFAHLILIFLVVLIGIGVLGYFAFKNGQIKLKNADLPVNTPTPTIISYNFSNWFTYNDKEYNYSISYPPELVYNIYKDDGQPATFTSPEKSGPPKYHLIITPNNNPQGNYDEKLFRTWGSSCVGNCPLDSEGKKTEGVDYKMLDPTVEIKSINNATVYYLRTPKESTGKGRVDAIIPIPNKKMYLLVDPNIWPEEDGYKLFDQILSTFKFINGKAINCLKDADCPQGYRCSTNCDVNAPGGSDCAIIAPPPSCIKI